MTLPSEFSLRQATAADVPALNVLMQSSRAYEGEYRRMLDGYEIKVEQVGRDYFGVAEADGIVFGFYSLITKDRPELDLMFVRDNIQGRKLGALLIENMKRVAAGYGIAEVLIISHPPSVGFYERMGAVRTGTKSPTERVTWEQPILALAIEVAGAL